MPRLNNMILGLTKRIIVLDAETSSSVDLKKHGAARYWRDPSTRVLMLGFQDYTSDQEFLYEPHLHDLPKMLVDAAALPPEEGMFAAFNAAFDYEALEKIGLHTTKDKWIDIMMLAYMLSFAGGLDDVLAQFDVRDQYGRPLRKSPEGKRLIQLFCKREEPWYYHPTEWDKFKGYCRNDVQVEVELLKKCCAVLDQPVFHPMVRNMHRQWLLNQRINSRGIPVSLKTIAGGLKIKASETRRLLGRIKEITKLDNPNSVQQLSAWCANQEYPLENMQAAYVRECLEDPEIPGQVAEVLRMRLMTGKASVKKFDAFHDKQLDGRIHNAYTLCGASRTGRDASRGINFANLERGKLKDPMFAADVVDFGDVRALPVWLDGKDATLEPLDVLGSIVRAVIKAPEGMGVTAVDLKSIESVGLAWLAGCGSILDLFHEGKDTYKDFATRFYGILYEAVTKAQRTFCKPAVLGCLAADTKVLTRSGWKQITDVLLQDELWDGESWVNHGGLVPRGLKVTYRKLGLSATADHRFLIRGKWVEWADLTEESLTTEIHSETGLLSGTTPQPEGTSVNVRSAGRCDPYPRTTCEGVNQSLASSVLTRKGFWRLLCSLEPAYREMFANVSPTGSMQPGLGVRTHLTGSLLTMVGEGYRCGSLARRITSYTSSRYQGGTTRNWRLTGSTTTGTTNPGTFASLLGLTRTLTKELTAWLSTTVSCTPRESFTSNSPLRTGTRVPLLARYEKDSAQRRSSQDKPRVKERTYDIANCGPLNRFTVLTDQGPLIAHNCGYGASGTALVLYAKGLGVELDEDTANKMVAVFRSSFPEIPLLWRNLERAAKDAINNPGTEYRVYACDVFSEYGDKFHTYKPWPFISYFYDGTFLYCGLPSGRTLFYHKPEILQRQMRSKKKGYDGNDRYYFVDSIHYWGKDQDEAGAWRFISTWGGMMSENVTQAACRDILYHGLELIDQDPLIELVGSTYDESICLTRLDDPTCYERIKKAMTTPPPWLDKSFFLGADGYCNSPRYKKD